MKAKWMMAMNQINKKERRIRVKNTWKALDEIKYNSTDLFSFVLKYKFLCMYMYINYMVIELRIDSWKVKN